jgi:hypothetical protein
MLNEFKHVGHPGWDEEKIARCCPEPAPPCPDPPITSDCCYQIWNWELTTVNWKLNDVTIQLADEQRHLKVVTSRYERLNTWYHELDGVSKLIRDICDQLGIIDSQFENICKNCCYAIDAVEVLYCMIREYYYIVDHLQKRYDRVMHCIKCLNNPALNTTTGIGKVLADYGTALTAVVQTRAALMPVAMGVVDSALALQQQLCDEFGYQRLIKLCKEGLHCRKEEEEESNRPPFPMMPPHGHPGGPEVEAEGFCLEPILHFPIREDRYFELIDELRIAEKIVLEELTTVVNDLTKEQVSLTAIKASLIKALKEVTPA